MELFLCILQNSSEELPLWAERLICNGALLLFALAGCGFLWWARWEKKKVENMEEVTATCVDHIFHGTVKSKHGRRKATYVCAFEYTYSGTVYTERDAFDMGAATGIPDVGAECTVRIDPEHPEKPYYMNKTSNLTSIVMGITFIAMAVLGLVMYNIQFL